MRPARVATFDPRRRVIVMVTLLLLAMAGLVGQLLRIQIFDNDRYVAWGEDQRLTTTPLLGQRGEILDRNGEEFSVSLPSPIIIADPALVEDAIAGAKRLAPVLGADEIELRQKLAASGRFVYLEREATEVLADKVRELAVPGVYVREEPKRFHPGGKSLARGVLGVVGVDGEGLSGLEAQYDEALTGTPGSLVSERGLGGRTIPEGERERLPAIDGDDVRLTLDRALQFEVEQTLREHVAAAGAIGGHVVIADPSTGELLALTSVATLEDGTVVTTSDNRAAIQAYEPASVMKAMTFAALLDQKLATMASTRMVDDEFQLYEETFTDDEVYEPRRMSVNDILVHSSNTGTIAWALDLGASKLYDYMRRFGFGSETGLGFPGESPGILSELDDWSGTSIATIAIGQGIAVTPVQMLAAYNVIANGGVYMAPKLVAAVGDEQLEPGEGRRVIERQTAADITQMLTQVVEGGTARAAQVPGYAIAAKTGTARKVQESGGYTDAAGAYHYTATVAGFFPAEDPKFSMIVIVDEPATEIYASRVAAPLFGQLAAWTLRHYQVSPAGDVVFEAAISAPEDN